ncbi:LamG domain-containing protein [Peredibacter starrii]|uniref:LamG domain-containing protein n=1 Tax=Peredibacter starrii TaxID=28202 RepID=A0AAX4HPG7_9BACT|nr:LamG domain-containing protein [Peredibacter starrii]WPU65149.1 LamG domain-containing protein [Peredibacter starrii]
MKSFIWLALLFLVGCENPMSGDIKVSINNDPTAPTTGGSSGGGGGPVFQPFTHQIPFTTGTDAIYVLSDPTKIEITGDLVRLKPKFFVDDDATVSEFGGGLIQGLTWDSTKNLLRMYSTTNIFEHGIDWSPQVANALVYYNLNSPSYNGTPGEVQDSGPYSLHGVASTTFTNSQGKLRGAADFDGTKYLSVADNDALEGMQRLTISAWVRPTDIAAGNGQGIVAKRNDYGADHSYGMFFWGDQLHVDIDTGNNRFASNFRFTNDKWYHILVSFDGTQAVGNRVRLYINGHLDQIAAEDSSAIPNLNAPFTIGTMGGMGPYNFIGQIDEVSLWTAALDYGEVMYIYAKQSPRFTGAFVSRVFDSQETNPTWTFLSPVTPLPFNKEIPGLNGSELTSDYSEVSPNLMNGLMAYWKLNETIDTGANAIKDSVGTNHGTVSGTIELGDLRGIFSRGSFFSGGKVTINNSFLNNTPAFTISTWVSPSLLTDGAGGAEVSIIGKKDLIAIGIQSNYICARSHIDGAYICGPTSAYTGEWTHILVTGDASTFSLYINGQFVNSAPHSGPDYGSSAFDFNLGADVWDTVGQHYIGLMDEVAVWNRALTALEVKNLYRRGGQQLLYQVRSCANADCSDQDATYGLGWAGPGGDSVMHFSENHNYASFLPGPIGVDNTNVGPLRIPFSAFPALNLPHRYFQYKVLFTSNDINDLCDYGSGPAMCSPELKSVTIGPSYSKEPQTITTTIAITSPYETLNLNGFLQTLGANGCASEARYTLSADGTNFYYYDGGNWQPSTALWTEANDAINLGLALNTFPTAIGIGNLFVKAHLVSNGSQACEIDNIQIQGTKP